MSKEMHDNNAAAQNVSGVLHSLIVLHTSLLQCCCHTDVVVPASTVSSLAMKSSAEVGLK